MLSDAESGLASHRSKSSNYQSIEATDIAIDIAIESYDQYAHTRQQTLSLCRNLSPEDTVAQSMPDASPAKWHLAHTTWFFETFILSQYKPGYRAFDESFAHLFNSYYVSAGSRYQRLHRGLLTRPSLEQVLSYRAHVDDAMFALLQSQSGDQKKICELAEIGVHHEMQHQELLLTDILHLLSHNPLYPQIFSPQQTIQASSIEKHMVNVEGTMTRVGAQADEFSYDCEGPNHLIYLAPHALSNGLVTNAEWLEFIEDGGYKDPLLWLSDGWACREQNNWHAPLYWQNFENQWQQFGLDGLRHLVPEAPVCHVSYYEAEAFARWAGKRLPREHELEHAASTQPIKGNFVEQERFRPAAINSVDSNLDSSAHSSIHQLWGDVWEWTQSAFLPYPKFKAEQGALGEYNGKFMVNQFVLKGGSCATAKLQMRPSYRNFFYPHHRWQFSGLRLAEDL